MFLFALNIANIFFTLLRVKFICAIAQKINLVYYIYIITKGKKLL